jgi:hypothetical protein
MLMLCVSIEGRVTRCFIHIGIYTVEKAIFALWILGVTSYNLICSVCGVCGA